jgi:4-alpha-glucanotransferase
MLRKAFNYSFSKIEKKVKSFGKNNPDIYDYAVFMALKDKYNGTPWYNFPLDLRLREETALKNAKKELGNDINYHLYCQYLFFEQWNALKKYIHSKKIVIMGDLPIYVAPDSSDAWANRSAFQLNSEGQQEYCAAVPPDYFSETGQKWGNPLYDWESMRNNGFEFVIRRMKFVSKMFDILRLDHFIGYANYYSVRNDAVDAKIGKWIDGPGIELFENAHKSLPHTKFVAEDLGIMSEKVLMLMKQTGFPCMRVIQFAFSGEDDNMHLPQVISSNTLYYTSTHDNDTSKAFWDVQSEENRNIIGQFIPLNRKQPVNSLIKAVYSSKADYAVIPIADWLGCGVEGKINSPGTSVGNWGARYSGYTNKKLAERIKKFNKKYNR